MSSLEMLIVPPTKIILAQMTQFITSLLLVFILLLIGWIVSVFIIKNGITNLLKVLKVDKFADRLEIDRILAKGGITIPVSELIGNICYWLSILITFVVAVNAVGLTVAAELLQRIVLYVPNIISAIFILVIGMFVSALLKNIVKTATNNAGISQSNFLSSVAETVVIIFAMAIAMEQLQIGARIVELTVSIVLGSIGLGFAIAFGLGCKDMVGKSVAHFFDKLKK